jgi:hypothetical protein
MKAMAEMPDEAFAGAVQPLTEANREWIEQLEAQVHLANLTTTNLQPFEVPVRQAIDACTRSVLKFMVAPFVQYCQFVC